MYRTGSSLIVIMLVHLGVAISAYAQVLPGTPLYEGLRQLEQGEAAAAIPYLESALQADSLQLQTYVTLTQAYLLTNQPARADSISDKGLRLFPRNPGLNQLAAETAIQRGDLAEASQRYELLLEEFSSSLSSAEREQLQSRTGQLYTLQGASHFEDQDWEAASESFERALKFIPDSASSYHNLALSYQQQGLSSRAIEVIEKGLERHPESTQLIRLNAFLDLDKGKESSSDDFEILYNNNPEDADVGIAYAALLYREQKLSESRKVIDNLLKKYPEDREIHERIFSLYQQNSDAINALELLKRMRKNFPEDYSILFRLADYHTMLEQWEEAHATYDTLMSVPGQIQKAAIQKAELYEQQENFADGIQLLEQLDEEHQKNTTVLKVRGRLFEKQQQWTEAVQAYRQLIHIERSARHLFLYGRSLHFAEQYDEAEKILLESSDGAAPHPQALYFLALYEAKREETKQACNMLRTALTLQFERLERLQNEVLGSMDSNTEVQNMSGAESSTIEEINQADQLSEEIFTAYSGTCSEKEVSSFLTGMLRNYPSSGRLYRLAGNYSARQNNPKDAEQHLERAVRYTPNLDAAHKDLAENYEKQEKYREALLSWERYHSLNPSRLSYQKLVKLHRNLNTLDELIDRWKKRFYTTPTDTLLYEHLLQSLQLSGRFKEIKEIEQIKGKKDIPDQ